MDAVALFSHSSPLPGESLHIDGNLVLEQRQPIHIKQRCEYPTANALIFVGSGENHTIVLHSVQYPYAASPIVNISKIQSVQDLNLQNLVAQYRQRDCTY